MDVLVSFVLLLSAAEGDVFVADADTLVLAGNAVHLRGVDVPGPETEEGLRAKAIVEQMITGRSVHCRIEGASADRFKNGRCFAAGEDIGGALVASGAALDCARYSLGEYRALEQDGARDRISASTHCVPRVTDY